MRQIKFRCWDKLDKKMLFSNTEIFDDMVGFRFGHFNIDVETMGDIVLMQFTGLLDSKGTEIYQGDIVSFNSKVGVITYECGSFGIGFQECIDYDIMLKEIHAATGCDNSLSMCCNDNFISLWEIYWNYNCEENNLYAVEVIGNTFNNPELVNK